MPFELQVCEGHGSCICGRCLCDKATTGVVYSGKYCQDVSWVIEFKVSSFPCVDAFQLLKRCVTTLGVPGTPVAPSVPETVSALADLAGATGPGVDQTAVATRKRPGVANRQLSPMAPRDLPAQVTGLASAIPAGKIGTQGRP